MYSRDQLVRVRGGVYDLRIGLGCEMGNRKLESGSGRYDIDVFAANLI